LIVFTLAGILGVGFTAVATIYFYTPIHLGGFELQPSQISALLMVGGMSQALWTLIVFPRLHKRIGTGGILRLTALIWPFAFALNPIANIVLKKGWRELFVILAPIVAIIGSSCAMAFSKVDSLLP
jgi:Na+/melibiose symporter-like transporter